MIRGRMAPEQVVEKWDVISCLRQTRETVSARMHRPLKH